MGSAQSWQGPQANRILWMRAGVAASVALAKGLDVTLNKNNQDLHVSRENHQKLFAGFPKPVARAFPLGQGTQVVLGSLHPNGLVLKPCLCQESWELSWAE